LKILNFFFSFPGRKGDLSHGLRRKAHARTPTASLRKTNTGERRLFADSPARARHATVLDRQRELLRYGRARRISDFE